MTIENRYPKKRKQDSDHFIFFDQKIKIADTKLQKKLDKIALLEANAILDICYGINPNLKYTKYLVSRLRSLGWVSKGELRASKIRSQWAVAYWTTYSKNGYFYKVINDKHDIYFSNNTHD